MSQLSSRHLRSIALVFVVIAGLSACNDVERQDVTEPVFLTSSDRSAVGESCRASRRWLNTFQRFA